MAWRKQHQLCQFINQLKQANISFLSDQENFSVCNKCITFASPGLMNKVITARAPAVLPTHTELLKQNDDFREEQSIS